jgi:hypothetical protein
LTALFALCLLEDAAAARDGRQSRREEYLQSRPAGEPVMAIVSLGRQRVTVYDADGWIMRAPVSSGQAGYETPAGIYSILQRKAEHYSNLYDDAEMPFMQRLTWSGIALHAGALPGHPASHGCVRMPYDFAGRLFDQTKIGMRVIVMRDDLSPVDFSHPLLFKPAPDETVVATAPSVVVFDATPQSATVHHSLRKIAEIKTAAAQAATNKADAARIAAAGKYKEAARANKTLRIARGAKARAEHQVRSVERQLTGVTEPTAADEQMKAGALAKLADAQAQLEAVEAEVQPTLDAVTQLRDAVVAAERERVAAEEEAKEAKRKLAPVSVFVSRETQRLYVRQAREPLFDSPVTIAEPDKQLGTYVFTALAYSNGETDLRWNAVSMYGGLQASQPKHTGGHRHQSSAANAEAGKSDVRNAKTALDRISIPKEVTDRISQMVSPGSALIVSDEPLSRETGQATEFVVIMSGEPQGGIKIRRRPEERDRYERFRRRSPYGWGPSPFW